MTVGLYCRTMCGIIGYVGEQEATPILIEGLRRLEYRGYDSAGVAVLEASGGEARVARCRGKLSALEALIKDKPPKGSTGIGHTRWATHGRPSDENAHPHKVGQVAVIHNGIIENHMALRERLAAGGRRFASETDTEIVAHLIDEELKKGAKTLGDAVRRSLAQGTQEGRQDARRRGASLARAGARRLRDRRPVGQGAGPARRRQERLAPRHRPRQRRELRRVGRARDPVAHQARHVPRGG
jgi:glutamate synthase domain-containing protein 1